MSTINRDAVRAHFAVLERCISSEMSGAGCRFRLTNNSAQASPGLLLEVVLPVMPGGLTLHALLGPTFPQVPPQLTVPSPCASPLIDPAGRVVNYSSVYAWNGSRGRLSELCAALEIYFKQHPPTAAGPLSEVSRMMRGVMSELETFKKGFLSYVQSPESPRPWAAGRGEERSPQAGSQSTDFLQKFLELQNKTVVDIEETLERDERSAAASRALEDKITAYQRLRAGCQAALDDLRAAGQRFPPAQILAFLDENIEQEKKAVERLQAEAAAALLDDGGKLDALRQRNQLLNYYQSTRKLVRLR